MGLILLFAMVARAADEQCVAWSDAGALTDADVDAPESSGVAASTLEDGLYYTMNDAGGAATLLMFDDAGTFRGEQLVEGATNTDWEDLATGPCPAAVDAASCIYIADIGDNDGTRDTITLWVVPESTETIVDAVACPLAFPDGPRDAETRLVAPAGTDGAGTVRIVSKESDGEAKVFKRAGLTCGDTADALALEAEVQLDGPATGGAMTASAVVLRTLSSAWIWQDCVFTAETWNAAPEPLDLGSDPPGEAIAVTADGGFITTSESSPFRFRLIPCAETGAPKCAQCGCSARGAEGVGYAPLVLGVLLLRRRRR